MRTTAQPASGGRAFPVPQGYYRKKSRELVDAESRGMSLRDYFAGQALTNVDLRITMSDLDDTPSPLAIANYMYVIADAMLAAREAKL